MSKYNEKLATQSFVENSISNLMKTINNPDEATEAGIYKVIDGDTIAQFDAYILIVQIKSDDSFPIRQTKLTSDGMTYSRGFNQFEPPFPEFTQSTVSQNDMALFKLMVDSQFATIEDELERQRIITSVEGESIAMPDSSDSQLRGLKVMGKTEQFKTNGYQLFNQSLLPSGGVNKAVQVVNNGDGSFNVSNPNENGSTYSYKLEHDDFVRLFKTGKVIITGGGDDNSYAVVIIRYNNAVDKLEANTYKGESRSIAIPDNVYNDPTVYAVLGIYSKPRTGSITIKPMVYQDGDGAWEPYTGGEPAPNVNYPQPLESVGEDGSVDVNVHGYQLFDADALWSVVISDSNAVIVGNTATKNGVKLTNNRDGSFGITGNGNTTGYIVWNCDYTHAETIRLIKAGVIRLNVDVVGCPYFLFQLRTQDNALVGLSNINNAITAATITQDMLDNPDVYMRIGWYAGNGVAIVPSTVKPMLYQDGDGTWEPFKPIQTLAIPTPNSLPAVPVSSDGNYTDANGQQWVCDEIDFARGVYIKRVGELEITQCDYQAAPANAVPYASIYDVDRKAGSAIPLMCTHYKWEGYNTTNGHIYTQASRNGIVIRDSRFVDKDTTNEILATEKPKVVYELAEPIETPLSEEEIAAYKALHTHYPNTSIHNSENVYMAVDYVADTKNYVDNQIKKEVAELKALVLEV